MAQPDRLSEAVDLGNIDPETAEIIRRQIRDYRPVFDRLAEGFNHAPDEKVAAMIDDTITHYRPLFDRLADS